MICSLFDCQQSVISVDCNHPRKVHEGNFKNVSLRLQDNQKRNLLPHPTAEEKKTKWISRKVIFSFTNGIVRTAGGIVSTKNETCMAGFTKIASKVLKLSVII